MKTTVYLWLSEVVKKTIEREVRKLTSFVAVDKDEIVVMKDESNPKLLIINFTSPKGRQTDLAGIIFKNYTLYLDTYSDMAIRFHTKKRNRKSRSRQ